MKQENMKIVNHRLLTTDIYEMTLSGQLVTEMHVPGQFLHLRLPQTTHVLRRPISISQIDPKQKTCRIIYRLKGEGTKILAQLKVGEKIDVMGPLGNGFDLSQVKKGDLVYVVGGGIGIPPLYELARQLKDKKATVVNFLGYATKDLVYYEEEFKAIGETLVATDDGSYGLKGNVGNLLEIKKQSPQAAFACGASGLLKVCEKTFIGQVDNIQLSLEARMACGMGACYACVVPLAGSMNQNVKVCEDGPIFQAGKVVIE